jgi:hypothetical protein
LHEGGIDVREAGKRLLLSDLEHLRAMHAVLEDRILRCVGLSAASLAVTIVSALGTTAGQAKDRTGASGCSGKGDLSQRKACRFGDDQEAHLVRDIGVKVRDVGVVSHVRLVRRAGKVEVCDAKRERASVAAEGDERQIARRTFPVEALEPRVSLRGIGSQNGRSAARPALVGSP